MKQQMEGDDTEHFNEQGASEDSWGSIPQGASGKHRTHLKFGG